MVVSSICLAEGTREITDMKTAVICCRVSTEDQEKGEHFCSPSLFQPYIVLTTGQTSA